MSIPPRFMDELRARLTLSDIIGRQVRLTRAGREFKGCCPFHNEKTPSFYVNDDKQFYHCFGCGAHGDVIGFAMQHGNLSFIEAVETLAPEAGMQVPQQSPQDIAKAKKEKSLYSLMEEATSWMEQQLRDPANTHAYRYILERGNSEEDLRNFRIGYAPPDRHILRKFLSAQGYKDAQMIEAGVLRPGKQGRDPYAFFRERIMFPVMDRRGRVVAFGGRILPDHLRAPDQGSYVPAKYMNSSDTPLFHKGGMLYGESHARQAAIDGQPLLVVEGYVDVMACFKAGYRGAVAPLGTALTEEQILLLWKMIPNDMEAAGKAPILCFDGDEAGRRAARRACERILPLLKPGHSAKFAFLPEGQDPDSLIAAKGKKAFEVVVEGAIPLVEFIWRYHTLGKGFDTPEAKAGLAKALEKETLLIPDRDVQYHYRQTFRQKTYEAFGGKGQKFSGRKAGGSAQNWTPQIRRPHQFTAPEVKLLAALINHPEIFESVEEDVGCLPIQDQELDQLRQSLLPLLIEREYQSGQELIWDLQAKGYEKILSGLLSHDLYALARFARPSASLEEVYEGWKMTMDSVYQHRVAKA
ncbi:MAG: DNA primase [Alphaproteobacteria bacterium]|nr:DNA primase [Alphaproteobacteria bacterium]